MILINFSALHLLALVNPLVLVAVKTPTIVVARKTLNARTEINSLTNGNNIQRYLEQRRSTLGEKRGKRVDRYA